MGILNYTTKVAVDKTMGECVGLLSRRGVRSISTLYDDEGKPEGLAFLMTTEYGPRHFELPVRVQGTLDAMKRDTTVPRTYVNLAQAERTAWRIAADWLKAQAALIDAGLTTQDEVMLPFMVDQRGRSVYEVVTTQLRKELDS
jgi:hypothetical protein